MTLYAPTFAWFSRLSGTNRPWPVKSLVLGLMLASSVPAMAMQELEEADLRDATGEGIAIVLEDFALKFGPTSYFELTGTNEASGSALKFRRGDLRWYGMSYTSATLGSGQAWSGPCSNGILGLGCPMGGNISSLSPHDNPLILRAFDYTGTTMEGKPNVNRSVVELLFPSRHEPYRFAFWGEMNVGTGCTRVETGCTAAQNTGGSTMGLGGDKLQVQNIWNNIDQGGSIIRLFQTSTGTNDTLGLQYVNRFAADIRMSVAQRITSPDTYGQTPEFDDTEGLYIGDYRVFMPQGQLHYQAIVIENAPPESGNGTSGDLLIKVTPLPAKASVYNEFYGRTSVDDSSGGYDRSKIGLDNAAYHMTHGFVRMGDWTAIHKENNESDYPYAPPVFGSTDAPISGMISEIVDGACMVDRAGCTLTTAKNGRFSTADGLFFVAAPGETFTVFDKSPNYMSDAGTDANNSPNLDADLNANNIINGSPVAGDFSGRATLQLRTINLGDTNIQGMMVHSMSLRTLGGTN